MSERNGEFKENKKESFVLFYSEKCGECAKFNKLLQEYPDLNSCFEKIPIERVRPQQIPAQLTHVPGIISGNQLLMGPNAFRWLGETVKRYFGSGPVLSAKGGFADNNFSFIGDTESDYSSGFAKFGKESQNNGSSIDPGQFDSRTGQPSQSSQQQQSIPQNTSKDNAPSLPPQLQPQQISNDMKMNEQDFSRIQQQRELQDQQIRIPGR